jgi:hypothetical protein
MHRIDELTHGPTVLRRKRPAFTRAFAAVLQRSQVVFPTRAAAAPQIKHFPAALNRSRRAFIFSAGVSAMSVPDKTRAKAYDRIPT